MSQVRIPKPIHPSFTFRNFVEFVGDYSVFFATHSGITKLTLLIDGLTKAKKGVAEWDEMALGLLKTALNAEGDKALVLQVLMHGTDKSGNPLSVRLAPRELLPYLNAVMAAK